MRYMRTRRVPCAFLAGFLVAVPLAISEPLVQQAEVGLEMTRVLRVALEQTQRRVVIALARFALLPFLTSQRLPDCEADVRHAGLAFRRRDDEHDAGPERERAGARHLGIERRALRLYELGDHVGAQAAVRPDAECGMK